MSIGSISGINNVSVHGFANRAKQFVLDTVGGRNANFIIKNKKVINGIKWIGREISSPENRLILGVTALMSQPFIDARNKTLDDNIKELVVARTVAKTIVGTTTGVIIRKACIKAIDYMTVTPDKITEGMKHVKFRQLLLPLVEKIEPEKLKNYKNTLGTLLALGVMIFTNFKVDAPLTQWMTVKYYQFRYGGKKDASPK